VLLVAISGWGQQKDRERSREAGFDHHIVKPARAAELRRLLAS
jgi:CheY-like chemotaxis protein